MSMSSTFQQILRYCLVGGVNTLIDVLVLNALLWRFPTHNVQFLVVENSLAYASGAVSSFCLNKYWTFQRMQRPTRREAGRFLLSVALEIVSSNGLLWLAGMALSPLMANVTVWGNASKLLAVAANAMLSYLLMRFWIFASGSSNRRALRAPIPTAVSGPTRNVPSRLKKAGPGVKENITRAGLSVILPAYNEEAVIARTVADVLDALPTWTSDFEVIVVNDGSQDATAALLEGIAAAHRQVTVLHHVVNQGYGAALVTGFKASTKDLVFFMDSDGQFAIRDLERFFPLLQEYDAVLGYRLNRQDTWMRKLNAWGWKVLVGMVLGVHVRDIDCAFKLYPGTFLREQRLETRGAMINAEILSKFTRAGLTYTQIGVRHLPRKEGRATGAKPAVILRALRELFFSAWKWHHDKG
ncbi:GtrA and DPM_DPG-synthase_like domain-containing protein [Ktedonobacteria bacterium brp13]|nr:GtrA and DPM_DPG-synthase_like domain-containing protein [Ktedonobacteria bacterium brp13]